MEVTQQYATSSPDTTMCINWQLKLHNPYHQQGFFYYFLIIDGFKRLGLISKAPLHALTTESPTIMKVSGKLLMVLTAVLAANLGIL